MERKFFRQVAIRPSIGKNHFENQIILNILFTQFQFVSLSLVLCTCKNLLHQTLGANLDKCRCLWRFIIATSIM